MGINEFLYPTSRAITATIQEYERLNSVNKITWGLKYLDNDVIPLIPGLLYGVLAYTSNGKTSLLTHIARNSAKQCEGIIAYATWETLVEQFITSYISHVANRSLRSVYTNKIDIHKAKKDLMKVLGENITIIGRSMSTPIKERFTLDKLEKSLEQLNKMGMIPKVLIIDYLQRITPVNKGMTRTQEVTEHIFRLKNIAQRYKLPVVFAVQAGRVVNDRNDGKGVRWPSMSDVQWASAVEQESDVLIGITRPIQYIAEGEIIKQKTKKGVVEYEVTQGLIGVNIIKQRFGPVGMKYFYNFNVGTMEFTPIDRNVRREQEPPEVLDDFNFGGNF